jgi:phosphoglycolate phosphatase
VTRLAVFDCDGTLVDSQADICAAMDEAFAAAALPAPPGHAVRAAVGLSLPEVMRRLHPEGDEAARAALCGHYKSSFFARREAGRVAEPLYEGVAALIETLRGDGWLLGVATGKSDRGLAACLETHGLSGHFLTLQTADRHPSKPHPAMLEAAIAAVGAAPASTAMIGDTAYDMAMARAAGAHAIGVAWGYHAPDQLRAAGAEAVADSPAQLGAILAGLR